MQNVMRKVSQTGKKKIIALLATLVSFVVLDGLLTAISRPEGKGAGGKPHIRPAGRADRLYGIEDSGRAPLRLYPVGCLPALSQGGDDSGLDCRYRLRHHRYLEY